MIVCQLKNLKSCSLKTPLNAIMNESFILIYIANQKTVRKNDQLVNIFKQIGNFEKLQIKKVESW